MKKKTLLIVDDMEINRIILRTLFEGKYNILEAGNGEQAMLLLHQYKDTIAVVLLDIVMPVKSGYEVMEDMKNCGLLERIPVIVITSQDSTEDEVRALDLGASDLVTKPIEPHVVDRRVRNIVELNQHRLHLEELVEEQAGRLRESSEVLMDALSTVIEHRSIESGQHVLRIRMFTKILLKDVMHSYPEYDLNEHKIEVISSASALHDIGKIAIPDVILNKPGRLTQEEFEIMKTHTLKGCEILDGFERMHDKEYLQYAYNICRYHHERWDGRGYPEGLMEENIPICAQAVGIADVFDALTTDRVYKKAYSCEKAFNMVLNGECGHFSPRLLESFKNVRTAFFELVREYADGLSPKTNFYETGTENQPVVAAGGTLELSQMKYFAMLRYEDSTVMEVDMDAGVYHLVYKQNSDFDALRSGELFMDSYDEFIRTSVHPDDQENVRLSQYLNTFLASGATKQSRKYRVFHKAAGDYVWYEVTILRINTENPRVHKILLVWREQEQNEVFAEAAETNRLPLMGNSMIGLQQCRNDQWFTIVHVNDGFISLLGYSRDDMKVRFHNHYIEMVQPEDRALLREEIHTQANEGNSFEIEYRVMTKDGRTLWVLDKSQLFTGEDGSEYLNCVLMDITRTKEEQEELRLSMERNQIIMDQTNDIIFEWDIQANKLYFSQNWAEKFGYQPITEEICLRIPQASHILPEDIPVLIKLLSGVGGGVPYGEAEFRIADAEGRYLWIRVRATTQFDSGGKPVKAVGVIADIDEEKRRMQKLIDKADRDNLTGLYNKGAAMRRIDGWMKEPERTGISALMILDMDNFKQVNDTRGHLFGDAVLMEVAAQLKKLFRPGDIVSRIGGDEFLIYMKSLPSRELIFSRAERLVNGIRNVLPEELRDCRLSCSVGVACFPGDADNFQDMFQCCDRALYKAKALGKNRFLVYEKETMARQFALDTQQMAVANTRIESNESFDYATAGLIQQVFRLLYQVGDTEKAVQAILELVGRRYQVSRVYIFEEAEDGSFCSNTFEWCKDGIAPQNSSLQRVMYSDIGNYQENFDVNGVFYCSDIATLPKEQCKVFHPQGVRSLLQCAIYDNGRFAGFVGFDDCAGKRLWTQSQINALSFVSELLSTFLLKKRVQDRLADAYGDLHALLDNQNSLIYVIDPDTYELQYINQRTCQLVPEARIGMRCHKAFFDRGTPCERCPAKEIREMVNRTLEIYNPLFKVWTIADASLIRWTGKEACLLACHDITSYKEQEVTPDAKKV